MHFSKHLRPRRFSDLVAQISFFRPGPVRGDLVTPYVIRRNGREGYSVPLPELDEVLRPTYEILMYQEQVLEMARMAGLTQMTVWRLENGFEQAHPQTIRKIAGVLGVKSKELIKKEV